MTRGRWSLLQNPRVAIDKTVQEAFEILYLSEDEDWEQITDEMVDWEVIQN